MSKNAVLNSGKPRHEQPNPHITPQKKWHHTS